MAAVGLAVSVIILDVGDEVGLKDAVTPLGRPLAVKAKLLLKPPVVLTAIVDVVVFPCLRIIEFGAADIV